MLNHRRHCSVSLAHTDDSIHCQHSHIDEYKGHKKNETGVIAHAMANFGSLGITKIISSYQSDSHFFDSISIALLLCITTVLEVTPFAKFFKKDSRKACTLMEPQHDALPYGGGPQNRKDGTLIWMIEGISMYAQQWIQFSSVRHFGLFFTFLLNESEILLAYPLANMLGLAPSSSQHQVREQSVICIVIMYLLIAGIDALDFGLLIHAMFLIVGSVAVSGRKYWLRLLGSATQRHAQEFPRPAFLSCSLSIVIAFACSCCEYLTIHKIHANTIGLNVQSSIHSVVLWLMWHLVGACYGLASRSWMLECNISEKLTLSEAWKKAASIITCGNLTLCGFLIIWSQQYVLALSCFAACGLLSGIYWTEYYQTATLAVEIDTNRSDGCRRSEKYIINHFIHIFWTAWNIKESRRILIFLCINSMYMFIEFFVGYVTNSLGLMGDAGHMLIDNSALVIGLVASYLSQLPPNDQFTYGFGRVETLSGLLNSVMLLVISFHLFLEAICRIWDPPTVMMDNLLVTSIVGLFVNMVGLIWFHDSIHHSEGGCQHHSTGSHGHSHGCHTGDLHGQKSRHDRQYLCDSDDKSGDGLLHASVRSNLTSGCEVDNKASTGHRSANMYGLYLHVLADTLGSLGVIVSTLMIKYKKWYIADPISSAIIAVMIAASTATLFKETLLQLLQSVPTETKTTIASAFRQIETQYPGIQVTQWHFWQHTSNLQVFTLQLRVSCNNKHSSEVLNHLRSIIHEFFVSKTLDLTIQIEALATE